MTSIRYLPKDDAEGEYFFENGRFEGQALVVANQRHVFVHESAIVKFEIKRDQVHVKEHLFLDEHDLHVLTIYMFRHLINTFVTYNRLEHRTIQNRISNDSRTSCVNCAYVTGPCTAERTNNHGVQLDVIGLINFTVTRLLTQT